ncbi:MAG: SprT-like domain-containing protein [Gammaproteobacteria bacterium SHHR-1]|uniref:SprT family zinc-dependent metalloprotease n=1 Tax=Magnetovirga frankeli TaxID=947516 RepID=UPI001AF21743|nr:SprT-like domain-containing protein [gamma proteobacterium SS-5]
MQEELEQQLRQATLACLAQAEPLLRGAGRCRAQVRVLCDLRGKAAGQAVWAQGETRIRYNLALAKPQPEAFIQQTVPHEVAHVVTRLLHPRARPHGPEWRAVMAHLGIADAQRCHSFAVTPPGHSQRRWPYRCPCREHQLSTTRHNRILRGERNYLCRYCGSLLQRV